MPDYKEMYFKLFRAHSKVLAILDKATLVTEEMAMEAKEPLVLPVDSEDEGGG